MDRHWQSLCKYHAINQIIGTYRYIIYIIVLSVMWVTPMTPCVVNSWSETDRSNPTVAAHLGRRYESHIAISPLIRDELMHKILPPWCFELTPVWKKTCARHFCHGSFRSFPQFLRGKNAENPSFQLPPPSDTESTDAFSTSGHQKRSLCERRALGRAGHCLPQHVLFFSRATSKKLLILAGGLLVWNDFLLSAFKNHSKNNQQWIWWGCIPVRYLGRWSWTSNLASDRSPCSLDMADTCHPIVTGSH